jgi:hypothetical protein
MAGGYKLYLCAPAGPALPPSIFEATAEGASGPAGGADSGAAVAAAAAASGSGALRGTTVSIKLEPSQLIPAANRQQQQQQWRQPRQQGEQGEQGDSPTQVTAWVVTCSCVPSCTAQ